MNKMLKYSLLLAIFIMYPIRYIIWDTQKKLQYKDFKGAVDKSSPNAGNTAYNFEYTGRIKDKALRISSKVVFDTEESWLKANDALLLSHEQLHFDIAELYNRAFKLKCSGTTFSKVHFGKQLDSLFDATEQECDKMQNKYDVETRHGVDKKKQSNWTLDIQKRLEQSTIYKDSILIAKIK
jgi:hypothetical protein